MSDANTYTTHTTSQSNSERRARRENVCYQTFLPFLCSLSLSPALYLALPRRPEGEISLELSCRNETRFLSILRTYVLQPQEIFLMLFSN